MEFTLWEFDTQVNSLPSWWFTSERENEQWGEKAKSLRARQVTHYDRVWSLCSLKPYSCSQNGQEILLLFVSVSCSVSMWSKFVHDLVILISQVLCLLLFSKYDWLEFRQTLKLHNASLNLWPYIPFEGENYSHRKWELNNTYINRFHLKLHRT